MAGKLKLIDFGLAVEIPSGETSVRRNFVGGTKDYLSPETLSCYVVEEGSLRERQPAQVQMVSFLSSAPLLVIFV